MTLEKLKQILISDNPSILLKENEKELFDFIKELEICKGFDQKNKWHIYDVYEHILHVVDFVENEYELRLAALFHDIGKPIVFVEDENHVGHSHYHWIESQKIFDDFADKNHIEKETKELVSKLILYHDINMGKIEEEKVKDVISNLNNNEMIMLFKLKRADLLAQSSDYHYLLSDYEIQEEMILKEYKLDKESI